MAAKVILSRPMTKEQDNFRTLIILSFVTAAISAGLDFAEMPVTDDQIYYLGGAGAGALINPSTIDFIWYAMLFLYAAGHMLAFFFVWFSKPIFVITFLVNIFMAIAGGLSVSNPWTATAWTVHYLFFNFAFGMLFFAPTVNERIRSDLRKHLFSQPPDSTEPTQIVVPGDGPN